MKCSRHRRRAVTLRQISIPTTASSFPTMKTPPQDSGALARLAASSRVLPASRSVASTGGGDREYLYHRQASLDLHGLICSIISVMRPSSRCFPNGAQACRKMWHLKKISAGCAGNLCSMVILFRTVQIDHNSAPTLRHTTPLCRQQVEYIVASLWVPICNRATRKSS